MARHTVCMCGSSASKRALASQQAVQNSLGACFPGTSARPKLTAVCTHSAILCSVHAPGVTSHRSMSWPCSPLLQASCSLRSFTCSAANRSAAS